MVKAKRHSVIQRIKRYIKKYEPSITSKQFEYTRNYGKEMLAFWLAFIDVIEKITLETLSKYNITGNDVLLFLNYAKSLVNRGKITNFLSVIAEYINVLDTTLKRNTHLKNYEMIFSEIEEKVSIEIGQYIHLWYGFYDLAYYNISTYF